MNTPIPDTIRGREDSGDVDFSRIHVLIVDDEVHFTEELKEFFQNQGFYACEAHTAKEAWNSLREHSFDLLILDVLLPDINGIDLLKKMKQAYPGLEVIIISAHGDMDTVIEAMRNGAIDYLRKPFRHVDIQISISRIRKFLHLQRKIKQIEEENSLISESLRKRIDRHFIGVSDQIFQVLEMALTAANYPDTNVLITGESGTGKENIARIIHYESPRKNYLLTSVNSSAVTESLMESEFFGHKKGSFTGATSDKKGFFEISNQGTLFLDEIADMPLSLQSKVLRAIEEKKITRVGDTELIATDFRIIAATNHDLNALVETKKFRLDLLHRLNTLHIHIPPLRDRVDDIEPLLRYFLGEFSRKINKTTPSFDQNLISALQKYSFPGNVRELKNMAERAIILSKEENLTIKDFPGLSSTSTGKPFQRRIPSMQEQEIDLIRQALRVTNFNQKEAADILGITRDALIRRMKKYRIRISKNQD